MRRGHASKIDAWILKVTRKLGGTTTKLGPIALNFGHVIRLASSTFCMYLVLRKLDLYFSKYNFKYGNPRWSSRSSLAWFPMLI